MKKILIANRGEIAHRIIRTAKEMGIATVAVYSDPDRELPFVRFADEAERLGPAPSGESYLDLDKVIEVAHQHNVDAIHPGYGFLSENPEFADRVENEGLTFIGPPAKAINIMGDKLRAKAAVKSYDIPLVPGTDEAVTDLNEAERIAKEIGFPILIKAAAGGGGKGMRIVEQEEDFRSQMERAQSEAKASFGDDSVFIEKYIGSPKHIEVQVLSDKHDNHTYLFERECSIQRRHQKVIEEAPSPVVDSDLRKKLGESAVNVARSCGYQGAGTVEFIMDEDKNFYFLEMNTRLQVEHPVTEMITGIDLVREQINIARGEELRIRGEEQSILGHAVELRVYAEDPYNQFLPSTGLLRRYKVPSGGGVRVDNGYDEGTTVRMHYDPMIAKLVTYGKDRQEAINKMLNAISEYEIDGVENTLAFGTFVLKHEQFINGSFDTHFVQNHFDPEQLYDYKEDEAQAAALVVAELIEEQQEKKKAEVKSSIQKSNWKINRRG